MRATREDLKCGNLWAGGAFEDRMPLGKASLKGTVWDNEMPQYIQFRTCA